MRIAVTDYDGTLGDFHGVKPDVIDAIHAWRAAGNKFGVATGRSRVMLNIPLDSCGIPVDFLICCNGAHICDENREELQRRELPAGVLADLLEHPASRSSLHCVLCSDGPLQVYVGNKLSWLPSSGLPFQEISRMEAARAGNQLQYSLFYHTPEEGAAFAAALNRDFGSILHAHPNGACIDITRSGVTKATGVEDLLRLMGWEEHSVLAIGDGGNDLPMITRFRGFTVPAAAEIVKDAASRIYADVGAMLRDNM